MTDDWTKRTGHFASKLTPFMKNETDNHRPRWRVSEPIATRLSQIRRDHGETWDHLFTRMIRALENHTVPIPASQAENEIHLIAGKAEEIISTNRHLMERMEELAATIAVIEPLMEQNNQLFSNLVKLLQLAFQVEADDKRARTSGRPPTKLSEYLRKHR